MSSDRIDVTDIDSHTRVTVTVRLGNGPVIPAQYLKRDMVADWVKAEYQYNAARGWWFAVSVTVAGQRVLKPGPDGTQRLGKDRHKSTYGGWSRDVQESGDLPGWLDPIISELRPSGELSLPGV